MWITMMRPCSYCRTNVDGGSERDGDGRYDAARRHAADGRVSSVRRASRSAGMVGPMYQPNMPMQYPPGMMGYPTSGDAGTHRAASNLGGYRIDDAAAANCGKLGHGRQALGRISIFAARYFGYCDGAGNFDGRVRYWHYDRNSECSRDAEWQM